MPHLHPGSQRLLAELAAVLDEAGLIVGPMATARAESWSSARANQALAIARPTSTAQVAAVLRICNAANQKVVPIGGGTGLVAGAIANPDDVLLSLERMREIEHVDPLARTARVQAGVILEELQRAAAASGLFFPLDLGARGTATIGGNISTNAGGNRVIRFGMMRDMVLGVEAVLANGEVLSSMNELIKNNAGYDLKQLFIGSEGTLGIVTRAVVRLREHWTSQSVALLATDEFPKLVQLLKTLDQQLAGTLSAFEVMWPEFYELVTTAPARNSPPLARGHAYYCLVEALGGDVRADQERFEGVLATLIESGVIADAAIATSREQAQRLWALRDDVEQVGRIGPLFMFDIGLPIREMERYVARLRDSLKQTFDNTQCVIWGHMGDSNLHIWITVFDDSVAARSKVEEMVYGPLTAIGGTVSAEHGIGTEKLDYLKTSRTAAEISVMRQLKAALDPRGILNPGKVIA